MKPLKEKMFKLNGVLAVWLSAGLAFFAIKFTGKSREQLNTAYSFYYWVTRSTMKAYWYTLFPKAYLRQLGSSC